MGLAKRIIARLDIKGKKLIKGIRFEGLRVLGDAVDFAEKYYLNGIDEILYIDAVASLYGRNSLSEILSETSKRIFVPITAGGGIRSVDDAKKLISNGADKVAINTGLVEDIGLANKLIKTFGSQCVVASIQAKRNSDLGWEVMKASGRERTGKSVIDWINDLQTQGVGEILITSVDMDGFSKGIDKDLVVACSKVCEVPLIIGGGFGYEDEVKTVIKNPRISGLSIGTAFHKNKLSTKNLKDKIKASNPNLVRVVKNQIDYDSQDLNNSIGNLFRKKNLLIVDYGLGNNLSLYNALEKLDYSVEISHSINKIKKADLIFLPGVGSFAQGISNLRQRGIYNLLIERAKLGKPIIGICLGMQLLFDSGTEFKFSEGLGLIRGTVQKLDINPNNSSEIFLPHIGWNEIYRKGSEIRKSKNLRQYFVHSYAAKDVDEKYVTFISNYSDQEFIAAVRKDNIAGFQFHPERSGIDGLNLLSEEIVKLIN